MTVPPAPPSERRRAPKQARSRATVAAIREAAARVLAAEGYEGATTNRIAAVAGVSIGTLYQYFDDREAVFDAVVEDRLDALVEAVAAALALPAGTGLDARLAALATAGLAAVARYPTVLPQLDAIAGASFRQRLEDARARARDGLVALIALHPDEVHVPDVPLAVRLLVDAAQGVLFNLRPGEDTSIVAREVAVFAARYLRGG